MSKEDVLLTGRSMSILPTSIAGRKHFAAAIDGGDGVIHISVESSITDQAAKSIDCTRQQTARMRLGFCKLCLAATPSDSGKIHTCMYSSGMPSNPTTTAR